VYGVSGTGKSSLINCGLANKFRDEDWLPLNIRRGKNMLESMYAAIVAASLTPRSQYSASETQFRKFVKSLYLDHYKPIYFIFDQFEELFIFGSKEEKSLFIRVIKDLVDSTIQCRFIFVMREEYMASVTEFERHIPVFFSNRVRIENMDINNATHAIKGPCKVFNINVEEGFPEMLIESLRPGSPDIELTYLQVFLDKIYRMSVGETGNAEAENRKISFTLEQLHKVGNVSDLLGTFLNEQISLLSDPDTALAVLKSFVSIKGTKRQMSLDEVKEYSKTLGKPINDTDLLEMLQNFVHLRILSDKDQHERYELRHDSLATRIFEKISVVEKDILEIRQFIEDGYHNWKKRSILLSASDLDYIAPYESRLFLSPELLDFITQSKNQLVKVKQHRRVIFIASTIALLILFAGFTIWALIERNKSKNQENIAKANYYNALSKEFANSDPTKAFRLADYSFKLDPSKSNFQNLVNIYSNNDFYYTYPPTKTLYIRWFKVLDTGENIAVATNNQLLLIDPSHKIIRETKIELPTNYHFDVSDNEKNYLIYSNTDQTLAVYDISGNPVSTTEIHDYVYETFFLPDSKKIFAVTIAGNILRLSIYSLTGEVISEREEPLPPDGGSFLRNHSSDTIYFIRYNGELYGWVHSKDKMIKTKLKLSDAERTYNAQVIGKDRFIAVSNMDSLRIYDLKGNILAGWFAGDKDNSDFGEQPPIFLKDQNLICLQNERGMKLWNLSGQNISNIKLGNQASLAQYNYKTRELLFLYNNTLTGYLPDNIRNELISEKENARVNYLVFGNKILEVNNKNEKLINWKDRKLTKTNIDITQTRIYRKIPGTGIIRTHVTQDFKSPSKPDISIFDYVSGDSLVHLKDAYEMPYNITSSEDGTLIATFNKILDNGYYNTTPYFTLYNSKGDKIKQFQLSYQCDKIAFSNNNRKILSTDGRTAILWDTSGVQLCKYIGHTAWINDLDLSYNNDYILTGSTDKTVRLWSADGKPLKVIDTESNHPVVSFFKGELMFQIAENNFVKIFDINGILIQKIPTTNSNVAIYLSGERSLIYTDIDGLHKIILKEPVDKFLLSNNYPDLSLADKIGYNILSVNDLLKSKDPYEIYTGAVYYIRNVNREIDVSEKRNTIRTAEKLLNKGLEFDTLHSAIARQLSQMYIQESQFIDENVEILVERCYRIMTESTNSDGLLEALTYYSSRLDTTRNNYKYPEKVIMISEKLLKQYPAETGTRERISIICSNLSFHLFNFNKQYQNALKAVNLAIIADSTNLYSYTNLPLAYLFNNRYDEAVMEYKKWIDKPWTVTAEFKTFREVFRDDIRDLETRGITHPDFEKVKELLKK
jgi:WD40 repeat protein